LLLHIGAVIFLFLFLYKTTNHLWSSAFAAAFFALHPLRVESVAWASERKDVLSLFFGMASLYAYAFYVRDSRRSSYIICLILFALGLLSKSMLVTLPFVFLLMDYWPLGRWQGETRPVQHLGNLIVEKTPFFVLTIASSIVTVWAQYGTNPVYTSLPARLGNTFVAYVFYLKDTFWPVHLALFYLPEDSFPASQIFVSGLIVLIITFSVLWTFRKLPFLFTGWFWFLGTLVPVIGLVPTNAFTADHYTYLPSIGIAIMLSWGIPALIKSNDVRKKILFPTGIIVIAMISVMTWKQCGYWKNSLILWSHTINVTKNNSLAYNNLASALVDAGRIGEAIEHHDMAIQIRPDNARFYADRGDAYAKLGQYQLAIDDYNDAILIRPGVAVFHSDRGNIHAKLGDYDTAIQDYSEAIRISPDTAEIYYNRGTTHGEFGELQSAVDDFDMAIRLKPGYVDAYFNRGSAYAKMDRYPEAIDDFNRTILLDPDYALAYYSRGYAYLLQNNEAGCPDARVVCDWGECRLLDFARAKGLCD
ncbi:MAG: tetratricopeptide repeat protein, partial [Smithella sp.]|nr:tetratricopeptide repeat protein [Smithella sp.]